MERGERVGVGVALGRGAALDRPGRLFLRVRIVARAAGGLVRVAVESLAAQLLPHLVTGEALRLERHKFLPPQSTDAVGEIGRVKLWQVVQWSDVWSAIFPSRTLTFS